MKLQGRKRSIWSTFKNAYLRNHNLKSFWNKLNKENLTKDLIKTFDLFVNSKNTFFNFHIEIIQYSGHKLDSLRLEIEVFLKKELLYNNVKERAEVAGQDS